LIFNKGLPPLAEQVPLYFEFTTNSDAGIS